MKRMLSGAMHSLSRAYVSLNIKKESIRADTNVGISRDNNNRCSMLYSYLNL
jgi:hypothetical protein